MAKKAKGFGKTKVPASNVLKSGLKGAFKSSFKK